MVLYLFLLAMSMSSAALKKIFHLAGEKNQWADELSRDKLHRFRNRLEGRERISLSSLSSPQGNVTLRPQVAAWRDKLTEAQHPVPAS